ncbi:hypothetical protein GGS23DRAFT_143142 [Durotheca rogersii]|uniref:uncharacterized protein n=1 Tax=Durotheca rogersii TaxID=419775 RepID=UPI00222118D9|nr:uncharacterized protein GGS23DRAFT_143142 [Durotheca rogersii]KAI5861636.1 hypothetical protein GGS23DRAFT_143142 [Durotheca rogersii]
MLDPMAPNPTRHPDLHRQAAHDSGLILAPGDGGYLDSVCTQVQVFAAPDTEATRSYMDTQDPALPRSWPNTATVRNLPGSGAIYGDGIVEQICSPGFGSQYSPQYFDRDKNYRHHPALQQRDVRHVASPDQPNQESHPVRADLSNTDHSWNTASHSAGVASAVPLSISSRLPRDYPPYSARAKESNYCNNEEGQTPYRDDRGTAQTSGPLSPHSSPSTPVPAAVNGLPPPENSGQGEEERVQQVFGPRKEWNLIPALRRGRKRRPGSSQGRVKRNSTSEIPRPRRRGPLAPDVKEQATLKRIGKLVCVVCHYKKEKCDKSNFSAPDSPCRRCRVSLTPCVRYQISDAALYRKQAAPFQMFSKRWKSMAMVDISDWDSPEIRIARFSLVAVDVPYELKLRRFIPVDGDNLTATGYSSETYTLQPYGIANMQEAADSISTMVDEGVGHYLRAFVGNFKTSQLIWDTYYIAFRRVEAAPTQKERELLANTFRLWVCCRNISCEEHILQGDEFGVRMVEDEFSPYYSKFPACFCVLMAQLECIYHIRFLQPLGSSVLRTLLFLIGEKQKKYWFTIYLVLFMLLHSCSMTAQRDHESAVAFGLETQYCNPDSIKEQAVGAKILLAHFHIALQGSLPFKQILEGRPPDYTSLGLTQPEAEFVTKCTQEARISRRTWDEIRSLGDQTNELYWISQLYDDNWRPERMD